jgi:hypothetical protein
VSSALGALREPVALTWKTSSTQEKGVAGAKIVSRNGSDGILLNLSDVSASLQ